MAVFEDYQGIVFLVRTQNFPKNYNFLPPDTLTYGCVLEEGVKNISFSQNFVFVLNVWSPAIPHNLPQGQFKQIIYIYIYIYPIISQRPSSLILNNPNMVSLYQTNIYLFKINNRNTRKRRKIDSKTIRPSLQTKPIWKLALSLKLRPN